MTPLATWALVLLVLALVALALVVVEGVAEELHARREDRRDEEYAERWAEQVEAARADFETARVAIPAQRHPGAAS